MYCYFFSCSLPLSLSFFSFVSQSQCSKPLSFWVPSCLRLCVRTLHGPKKTKVTPTPTKYIFFIAREWAKLFKISTFFHSFALFFSNGLMCDFTYPNAIFPSLVVDSFFFSVCTFITAFAESYNQQYADGFLFAFFLTIFLSFFHHFLRCLY